MEKAVAWLAEYLADDPERLRRIQRIALMTATGKDMRYVARWLGVSVELARYEWQHGRGLIAKGLNARGVAQF